VKNWTEFEIGLEAVTQAKWERCFFFAFHIFGVVLVNNFVIAFIINSFLAQLEISQRHAKAEMVGDAVFRAHRAIFDATQVTGTKTSLSGKYIARIRHANSETGGH
jgi:hypothetical protein